MELFLFARFRARQGCEAELRDAIRTVEGPTRQEPGCMSYGAFRSVRVPGEFHIHSRWRDLEAFNAHATLPHTVRFISTVEKLIDHTLDISLTESMD